MGRFDRSSLKAFLWIIDELVLAFSALPAAYVCADSKIAGVGGLVSSSSLEGNPDQS